MQDDVADLRRDYDRDALDEASAAADPIDQFGRWFEAARAAGCTEPNAMALATATPEGLPSVRTVLLKGFDQRGFVFYTNFGSRKAAEIAANPNIALMFWWDKIARQVRIEGAASTVADDEADAYFASRPRDSQIGAWASPQSEVIASRELLERRVAEARDRFGDGSVARPPFWGGYLVAPIRLEFWQGRRNRLHDRLCYVRADHEWCIERLAP